MTMKKMEEKMFLGRKNGQALVEFALILPIFLIVLFGIIDFGRALHSWSSLNYQCIQAARAGTKRNTFLFGNSLFLPRSHADASEVYAAFWKYQSPYMTKKTDFNVGSPSNNPFLNGVGTNATTVEVRATYEFTMITPLFSLMGNENGTITISAFASEDKE